MPMLPAIFLDRDGVIIENRPNYIRSWSDVELYPQALRALAQIKDASIKIIIVTNQSAIGKRLISQQHSNEINDRLVREIQSAGGRIDSIYVCPHTPADNCTCRKPLPGLILKAAEDHPINLINSILIGDALSDIEAGRAAAVRNLALVLTGRGKEQLKKGEPDDLKEVTIYNNLEEAIKNLVDLRKIPLPFPKDL